MILSSLSRSSLYIADELDLTITSLLEASAAGRTEGRRPFRSRHHPVDKGQRRRLMGVTWYTGVVK